MPKMRVTISPASESFSGRMIGIAPATAASYETDAAHQLDHDVAADDQVAGIGREQLTRQIDIARRVDVAHRDAGELESRAGAFFQFVGVLDEQARDLRAHGSGAQQRYSQRTMIDHSSPSKGAGAQRPGPSVIPVSRARRSSIVSPRRITRASPSRTAMTAGRGTWL
jgi:hypothetical protein